MDPSIIIDQASKLATHAAKLAADTEDLAQKTTELVAAQETLLAATGSSFLSLFTIFLLACFVGYFVVWSVTPSLHTPLMSVTKAI